MPKHILILSLVLITLSSSAQKLPAQHDWFLPVGQWNNSPELYIKEAGTGTDTVIMLHGGWGADHEGLVDAVKDLFKQHHFIFYDQRGSLRSPFPDSLITYDEHIEDVERVRKAFGLSKIKLVGHSMGGVLAAAYASKYPNRIKTLVLLAPADLKYPTPKEDLETKKAQYDQFQKYFDRPGFDKEITKYNLQRPDNELSAQELNARFRINFARRMLYDITKWDQFTGGRALYKGNVFGLTEKTYPKDGWDFIESLGKQSFSTHVITGDHDFLDFNNILIKKYIAGKKQFTFTPIPKAAHMLWIDQSELFNKELEKALE